MSSLFEKLLKKNEHDFEIVCHTLFAWFRLHFAVLSNTLVLGTGNVWMIFDKHIPSKEKEKDPVRVVV